MAGQRFKNVWRIQNRGEVQWTGRKLRCVDAELVVARWEETGLAAGVGGGVFSEVDSDAEGSGDCVDGTGTHGRDRCHIQSVSCLATRFLAGRWWMRRVSGAFRNTAGFGARCRWWRFRVCLPRFIAWSTKCVLTMQSPLPMPPLRSRGRCPKGGGVGGDKRPIQRLRSAHHPSVALRQLPYFAGETAVCLQRSSSLDCPGTPLKRCRVLWLAVPRWFCAAPFVFRR